MTVRLCVSEVGKDFVMHLQGGLVLPAVGSADFHVCGGECVALCGPSGSGKSSILKMIYGNYRTDRGQILISEGDRVTNIADAPPRRILSLRRATIGYISQFLHVIPRIAAFDIVANAAIARGMESSTARHHSAELLGRLNVPERLWGLPPATFSGGEQQRVNIARGFIADYPILLLDEPTASLDEVNRSVVVELIEEKKRNDVALLGIFHDADMRERFADRIVDVTGFAPGCAA